MKTKLQWSLLSAFLFLGVQVFSQEVVYSIKDLLPYLKQSNVDVTLAPGVYNLSEEDVKSGLISNPILKFEGNNNTYDFKGVTINFNTNLFRAFGPVDVREVRILGNNNVIKNLKMVDDGKVTDAPTKRAQCIVMDGAYNKVEGFHLTVKGSYPYGYGEVFGKGGRNIIVKHRKHSAILVRGLHNHLKNTTVIHRSYGHAIFMQAADHPLIEGCYIEGDMRSGKEMLSEKGTGTIADKVDFETTWGYKIPEQYMFSLHEEGIRAYNGGDTWIDGVQYTRGTSNPKIINNTIKNMRAGVTLTHATGKKYIEGCVAIGCSRGFAIGSGTIVNCSADAQYGPVLGVDYDSDHDITAEITVLPYEGETYNGSKHLAIIIGKNHNITFKGNLSEIDKDLKIDVSGNNRTVGLIGKVQKYVAKNIFLKNETNYPISLNKQSSNNHVQSVGVVTDLGSDNTIISILKK
jgi:hypothetical protein